MRSFNCEFSHKSQSKETQRVSMRMQFPRFSETQSGLYSVIRNWLTSHSKPDNYMVMRQLLIEAIDVANATLRHPVSRLRLLCWSRQLLIEAIDVANATLRHPVSRLRLLCWSRQLLIEAIDAANATVMHQVGRPRIHRLSTQWTMTLKMHGPKKANFCMPCLACHCACVMGLE